MAEKKMTREEALEIAMNELEMHSEPWEVLNKMLKSIQKQKSRPRSKSSARVANEPIAREFIKKLAAAGEPVNAKWMTEHVKYCMSSQKAVAIAKIAEEWGAIERISVKNRTCYALRDDFEIPAEW